MMPSDIICVVIYSKKLGFNYYPSCIIRYSRKYLFLSIIFQMIFYNYTILI